MPDANAKPALPCSSAAILRSSASRVGLCVRAYSKPLCLSELLLHVGRRLVNRNGDRARRRVRFLTRVEADRGESRVRVELHDPIISRSSYRWPVLVVRQSRPSSRISVPPRRADGTAASLVRSSARQADGRSSSARALKIIVFGLTRVLDGGNVLAALDTLASIAVAVGGAYFLVRGLSAARRRLLWRVRRKLIISYIFIGFIPALLIAAFFLLGGFLLFSNFSSYLVQTRLRELSERAMAIAESTALEVRLAGGRDVSGILARRQEALARETPSASIALVPMTAACGDAEDRRAAGRLDRAMPVQVAGPWAHVDPPREVPTWIGCDGYTGLLAYGPPDAAQTSRQRGQPGGRRAGARGGAPAVDRARVRGVRGPAGRCRRQGPPPRGHVGRAHQGGGDDPWRARADRAPRAERRAGGRAGERTAAAGDQLSRVPGLDHRRGRDAAGVDAVEHRRDLRSHLRGAGLGRRPQSRPGVRHRAAHRRPAVPVHSVRGRRHGPGARPIDHRVGARAVHGHGQGPAR